LSDHEFAGFPPFLIVGAEEAEDCRDGSVVALYRRQAPAFPIIQCRTHRIGRVFAVTIETFV
jgi:hypothetical protein